MARNGGNQRRHGEVGEHDRIVLPPPFRPDWCHLADQLDRQNAAMDEILRTVRTLLARQTDISHVSIKEAAKIKRCSEKTIRNRISKGLYRFEHIPGTRESGVPVEDLFSGWMRLRNGA